MFKPVRGKVLAYITQKREGEWKLLVLKEVGSSGGYEVPGGTIEPDELLIDALYREIEEETGIQRHELTLMRKLKKSNYFPEDRHIVHERSIFLVQLDEPYPETWTHTVQGEGKDAGLTLQFEWVSLDDVPPLDANQNEAIDVIQRLAY